MAAYSSNTTDNALLPIWRGLRAVAPEALGALGVVALGTGLAWFLWGGIACLAVVVLGFATAVLFLSTQALERAHALATRADRSFRIERAVATASRALLRRDDTDPVGTALGALLDGADVDAVFLETNVQEPPDELGSTATVRDIFYADAPEGRRSRWELTGWRVGSGAMEALHGGFDYVTVPDRLDDTLAAYYRAMEIGSEVLSPITIEGRWVGSLGFLCRRQDRGWAADEKRLLRAVAEMIGAYWERRDARAELEEMLAAKDEFIASVSHEVRTPLTAVLGFASELDERGEEFSDDERADLTALLAEQSREVANIVDDLLTAARADAGTIVVVPEAVPVRKLIGEVLTAHHGQVEVVLNQDMEVWADPGRVRQVLRNLLTNADRYGGDTVRLHALHSGANTVRFEVRDNGEGIPYQWRSRVFEPYSRVKRSSTQPASMGLGLAVSRQLARMMGGDVVLSEQDGWTVFTLTLPVAMPQQAVAG